MLIAGYRRQYRITQMKIRRSRNAVAFNRCNGFLTGAVARPGRGIIVSKTESPYRRRNTCLVLNENILPVMVVFISIVGLKRK